VNSRALLQVEGARDVDVLSRWFLSYYYVPKTSCAGPMRCRCWYHLGRPSTVLAALSSEDGFLLGVFSTPRVATSSLSVDSVILRARFLLSSCCDRISSRMSRILFLMVIFSTTHLFRRFCEINAFAIASTEFSLLQTAQIGSEVHSAFYLTGTGFFYVLVHGISEKLLLPYATI
jgi:hypothetical protein